MAPRLKVFVTSDGLTDYVVAVSSKTKALEAWGSHQDLFKTGLARETDEPALVQAATAVPGAVVRLPARGAAELAKLASQMPKRSAKAKLAEPKPAGPTKAQLKKVADLESRMAALRAAHARQLEDLEARRRELEAQGEALAERQGAELSRLEAQLSAARAALGS